MKSQNRPRGRPRSTESEELILKETYALLAKKGFSNFSVDEIVAKTGVAKTTIYRRWPNKSKLAMSAIQAKISPLLAFPAKGSFEETLINQMRQLAKIFSGEEGKVISSLIGAAQDDKELSEAVLKEYLMPRRQVALEFLKSHPALKNKSEDEVCSFMDVVYGGLYFRLLLKHEKANLKGLETWIRLLVKNLSM